LIKDFRQSLAPATSNVLITLSKFDELKNFTLVGGSALSVYLQHRISEDLDFFTWISRLDDTNIDSIMKNVAKNHSLKILNTFEDGFDISINQVKVTFFANKWESLKQRKNLYENSFIGNLELLTAMKVHVISLRAKYRDYYDLFTIANKVFNVKEILDIALQYIPGMTKKIFAMQLVYIEDIEDENIEHLNPVEKVLLDDIRIFFEKEIKKIL